jgi:hypothetical protein
VLQGMREEYARRDAERPALTLAQQLSIHSNTFAAGDSIRHIAFTRSAFICLCRRRSLCSWLLKMFFHEELEPGCGKGRGDCKKVLRHTHTQEQFRPPN